MYNLKITSVNGYIPAVSLYWLMNACQPQPSRRFGVSSTGLDLVLSYLICFINHLKLGLVNLIFRRPKSKHFKLCSSYSLCCTSQLCHHSAKAAMDKAPMKNLQKQTAGLLWRLGCTLPPCDFNEDKGHGHQLRR